jgi:hypothetical protein
VGDVSVFDTRDQALLRFGSFQHTLRGRALKLYLAAEKVFRKLFTQTNLGRQLDAAALRQIHSFS